MAEVLAGDAGLPGRQDRRAAAAPATWPPRSIAAYDAPFPDDAFKAGARIFPTLVPTSADDPSQRRQRAGLGGAVASSSKPFVLAFSDSDPITKGGDAPFRAKVPGAQGRPHTTIEGGGHFLQEDKPRELAQVILDAIAAG